jgi:chromosome partitioning protein
LHSDEAAWQHVAMHVIALASRKGGSGKTTLTAHLAVAAEAAGVGQTAIIDTDPQGGLAGWWNARAADAPRWIDPAAQGLPAAVSAARDAGYGLLLIDTPPSVAATISEVLAVADLVVIPVRPSPNDLRAVGGTLELAKRARRRMVFVVNQATQRARITAEAAILLSQHGTVAPVMIGARVDFATSMTDGRTAGELDPASRSGAEIAGLWTYLHNLLTEDARYAEAETRAAE